VGTRIPFNRGKKFVSREGDPTAIGSEGERGHLGMKGALCTPQNCKERRERRNQVSLTAAVSRDPLWEGKGVPFSGGKAKGCTFVGRGGNGLEDSGALAQAESLYGNPVHVF